MARYSASRQKPLGRSIRKTGVATAGHTKPLRSVLEDGRCGKGNPCLSGLGDREAVLLLFIADNILGHPPDMELHKRFRFVRPAVFDGLKDGGMLLVGAVMLNRSPVQRDGAEGTVDGVYVMDQAYQVIILR